MDPVISTEDMDNASTAEGLNTFSTYSFLVLSWFAATAYTCTI